MKEVSYGIIPFLFTESGVSILMYRTSKSIEEYQFLKGKPIQNETVKETVLREVFEEIGMKLDIDDLFDNDFVFHKSLKKDIGLYFINFDKYLNEHITLEKGIYQLKWFNVDTLPNVPKNQLKFLTNVKEKFNKLNSSNIL